MAIENAPALTLSDDAIREIDEIVARYPSARSAVLPVMHVIQNAHGHIPEEARDWVARRLDMPTIKVAEVLSFYTMLHTEPTGVKHLQVCRAMSCWLRGEEEITEAITETIGLRPGERSENGRFSLIQVECLGSCDTAPVMQVNDDYHENLTAKEVSRLLREWSR